MTSPAHLVAIALAVGFAGALVVRCCDRHRRMTGWLTLGLTVLTSALVAVAAVQVLLTGPGPAVTLCQWSGPQIALRLHVDGLSAVFLLLIAMVSVPVALYAPGYLEDPHYRECSMGRYHANFLLFVAALHGLVTTTDMVWFFFVFWQLMTIPGYLLIRSEEGRPDHVRAANRYLWMMQAACVATLVGAGLLLQGAASGHAGERLVATDFDAVSHHLPLLLGEHPWRVTMAFALFLVGFGIKVGMWPFGAVWLPDAHPAAPAPVSAMLSGVMIKTGIYGILRYFIWLIPPEARELFPAGAWGLVIAALGTISLLLGTSQALLQEQTKRMLAWSTIGQGGYILLAIGASIALLGQGTASGTVLASLALAAALFHTVNHGLFKSLLFLVAGSLFLRTGTQDLNRMGGWLRRMPWTAGAALVAGLSIAGAPLTNGFASKWCLFVVTFQSGRELFWLPVMGAIGVLTSALTLAVMVKFFGAAFLGRTAPEERVSEGVGGCELPGYQVVAQWCPAVICLGLGLLPILGLRAVQLALETSRQGLAILLADAFPASPARGGGFEWVGGTAVMIPVILLVLLGAASGLAVLLIRWAGIRRRAVAPWLCGYAGEGVTRYVARDYFGALKPWLGKVSGQTRRGRSDPALRPRVYPAMARPTAGPEGPVDA
jgi:hydrogenase-4 component B